MVRYNRPLDLELTLESEKFTGVSVVRAFFLVGGKESHTHTEVITLYRQADPRLKCTDVQVYIIVRIFITRLLS